MLQYLQGRQAPAMEFEMSKTSKARLIVTDFAASLVMAVSIGLATSIALASAVLFIAEQSDSSSGTTVSSPEGSS